MIQFSGCNWRLGLTYISYLQFSGHNWRLGITCISYFNIDPITSLFDKLEKPQELLPSTRLCT